MAKAKKTPAKTGWEKIENVSQAARVAGLPVSVVMQRKHAGWTADRALSTPVKQLNRVKKAAATQAKHATKVPPKKDLPKVTNPLGGTGESAVPGSIPSVTNPEPLLTSSETETLAAKSAARVTQTESPLVTPDKGVSWIWMLGVVSLIAFVVALIHEAGGL